MATKIITKNSSTATSIPTAGDLVQGELAVNVTDKRLFTEDSGGAIVELGTNPSTLTSGASTFSGEITANGGIALGDNDKATFGASDDLQIYSDGSSSYIEESGPGPLFIRSNGSGVVIEGDDLDNLLFADTLNDSVKLYADGGNLKLATTATGIDVTGIVTADGLTVGDGHTIGNDGFDNLVIASSTAENIVLNANDAGVTVKSDTQFLIETEFGTDRFKVDTSTGDITFSGNLDIGSPYPITGLRGARRLVLNDTDQGVDFVAYSSTNGIVADQYIGGYLFGNDDNNVTEDHFAGMWANSEGTGGSMTLRFAAGKANYETDTPQMMIDGVGNLLVGKTANDLATDGIVLRGSGELFVTRANDVAAFNRRNSDGQIVTIRRDGTSVGAIGGQGGAVYITGPLAGGLKFSYLSSTNATIFPVTTTGATADGLHDLGYAGSRFRNLYLSNNLLIGGTTLNENDSAFFDTNGILSIARTSGIGRSMIDFRNAGASVGSISTTPSSTAYNTSSDYRLKEDDVPMTGATERVKALRPINFAWKVDGSRTDGFFAHEAQEVVPEAVRGTKDAMRDEEYEVTPAVEEVTDEDGNVTTEAVAAVMGTRSVPDYQGIDQSKLVPLLTATIQELIARIEALEGA